MENFEDFLKKEAQSFKIQPSEKVWQGIEAAVVKPGRSIAWWYAAAALVLVSCGTLWYFNFNPTHQTSQGKTNLEGNKVQQEKSLSTVKEENKNHTIGKVSSTETNKPGISERVVEKAKPGTVKIATYPKASSTSSPEKSDRVSDKEFDSNSKIGGLADETKDRTLLLIPEHKPVSYKSRQREKLISVTSEQLTEVIRGNGVEHKHEFLGYFDYVLTAGVNFSDPRNVSGFKNFVKPSEGFGLTFSTRYNFGCCWGLSAGIGYQQSAYTIGAVSIAPETIYIKGKNQDLFPQSATYKLSNESQHKNTLKQIIVPLALQYRVYKSNNNSISIFTGVDLAKIIGSRYLIKNTTSDRLFSNESLINPFHTYLSLGASYTHNLSNKLKLVGGYKMQYQLVNTFSNRYDLKENLMVNGLNLGIVF